MDENKTFYIYHHLGLGDHIICNAIVRNIHKHKYKNVSVFCKPHNFTSVQFMYRDTNINIIQKDDYEVNTFLQKISHEQYIRIGHQHLGQYIQGTTFDCAFYKQVGLDFKRRWTDFYVQRDFLKENDLFKKLNLPKDYVFLHDDPSRNFVIDRSKIINQNLHVFTPTTDITNNIFDYLAVIQNAQEVHCIDSCIRLMTDSILSKNKNLFFHYNLLNGVIKDTTFAQSKLNWIKI